MNIRGLNWGNRFVQTRTEPARSGFSLNSYNRNGPKTEPLLTLIIRQLEVEFPDAPDWPNGYNMVLIGYGTNVFARLRMLNGYLIVSFPFLLLNRFMQPRGSTTKEGDNVMARLHMTCPEPGNPALYSWLATSLRSPAIILLYLPLYYCAILTSTFATVSTDIPSYQAIHGRMPLHKP